MTIESDVDPTNLLAPIGLAEVIYESTIIKHLLNSLSNGTLIHDDIEQAAYADRSTSLSSHVNGVSLHHSLPIDEIYAIQGSVDGDIQGEDSTRLVTGSGTHKQMDNPDEESGLGGGPNDDMNSSQFQMQNIEHHEENAINMAVSCTAVSLQQLCLDNEDVSVTRAEDNPSCSTSPSTHNCPIIPRALMNKAYYSTTITEHSINNHYFLVQMVCGKVKFQLLIQETMSFLELNLITLLGY